MIDVRPTLSEIADELSESREAGVILKEWARGDVSDAHLVIRLRQLIDSIDEHMTEKNQEWRRTSND